MSAKTYRRLCDEGQNKLDALHRTTLPEYRATLLTNLAALAPKVNEAAPRDLRAEPAELAAMIDVLEKAALSEWALSNGTEQFINPGPAHAEWMQLQTERNRARRAEIYQRIAKITAADLPGHVGEITAECIRDLAATEMAAAAKAGAR